MRDQQILAVGLLKESEEGIYLFIYFSEDFTGAMLHVQSLFLVNHASENRSE